MLSIFGLVGFKPRLFLSGENLSRYVVTPENPRKLVGDIPASLKYYGHGSWQAGALAFEVIIPFFKGF
jgi:hypothetical protein